MDVVPRKLNIFLVENHDDTLNYLTKYLEQQGHSVQSARSMSAALDHLTTAPPHVLICDIGLPDGDGWELIQRLGEAGKAPFAIAMSGYGMRSDREKSLAAGFQHHLIKPFLPEELDVLLRSVEER